MPALNFTEIPKANNADGKQDTFEMLAKEYFQLIGLKVLIGPDRGQDGGRDLIVSESRSGSLGNNEVKWLVSCKHKAHSGKSVLDNDEQDITDRVRSHEAVGFIGFYSSIPSSGLNGKLERLTRNGELDYKIIDPANIESVLLSTSRGREIAKRYFPVSFLRWESSSTEPANLGYLYEPLECKVCGKDLLVDRWGNIVYVTQHEDYDSEDEDEDNTYQFHDEVTKYVAIYWSCKGSCDERLRKSFEKKGFHSNSWEDISDITIPSLYLRWIVGRFNRLRDGSHVYSDEAFDNLKDIVLIVSQSVLRSQSDEDTQRASDVATMISLFT